MAVYLIDSSALVKRYVGEAGSGWVTMITDPAAGTKCWIAALTRVEVVAALHFRKRLGTLSLAQAHQAETTFRHELATHFQLVPLTTAIFDEAIRLVAVHPLRAYDAMQLAAALQLQTEELALGMPAPTFLSADRQLNQAATSEGLQVDDPNLHP